MIGFEEHEVERHFKDKRSVVVEPKVLLAGVHTFLLMYTLYLLTIIEKSM